MFQILRNMKKVALVGGLAIFLAVFSGVRSVHAQDNPASWIFYLAFEDAVGARDTLWEVWHTDGTIHADMNLGEVPIILDSTSMNVWTYVYNNPDDYFDHHVVHFWGSTFEIYANNYVLPLTVTW